MARGSAPGERRGGRQAGTPNRKTHALRDAIEAEGVDPAIALVRIAKAAEGREDFGLAAECYGKVLPFLHAKPRTSADAHPDEALEFAKAMMAAKLQSAAETLANPGLAERLERAKARLASLTVSTGIDGAPDDRPSINASFSVIDAQPAQPAPAGPAPRPAMAEPPEPEPIYSPILPRASTDWSPPAAPWPEKQRFADEGSTFDREPYGGLLDAYKPDF
jgi:hypothetical protein